MGNQKLITIEIAHFPINPFKIWQQCIPFIILTQLYTIHTYIHFNIVKNVSAAAIKHKKLYTDRMIFCPHANFQSRNSKPYGSEWSADVVHTTLALTKRSFHAFQAAANGKICKTFLCASKVPLKALFIGDYLKLINAFLSNIEFFLIYETI